MDSAGGAEAPKAPPLNPPLKRSQARGYKAFFMLNSAEHEVYPAHKC